MILLSKVLWGSATVAMLAGSAVVTGAAEVAHDLAVFVQAAVPAATSTTTTTGPEADAEARHWQIEPRCSGSCDIGAVFAHAR